jgi:uncharacterized membrane protein YgdD (TMEM256/DUF423 family)
MERIFLFLAGINGVLAVALGAFGAHGLKARMAELADGAQRMQWWQTASHYHLVHALALALASYLAARAPGTATNVAGIAFTVGIVLFSGSLYAMTLSGVRVLGAITPLGGLAYMVGWAAIAIAAWRMS